MILSWFRSLGVNLMFHEMLTIEVVWSGVYLIISAILMILMHQVLLITKRGGENTNIFNPPITT